MHKACEYLKANPDFLEVRCFFPSTETGDCYFAAINDAVKGTAINRSDLYCGHGSLLSKYTPRVPESYLKWKAKQKSQMTESEERIVRQTEAKPMVDISPMLGEKKSAIIDRKEGGLKL